MQVHTVCECLRRQREPNQCGTLLRLSLEGYCADTEEHCCRARIVLLSTIEDDHNINNDTAVRSTDETITNNNNSKQQQHSSKQQQQTASALFSYSSIQECCVGAFLPFAVMCSCPVIVAVMVSNDGALLHAVAYSLRPFFFCLFTLVGISTPSRNRSRGRPTPSLLLLVAAAVEAVVSALLLELVLVVLSDVGAGVGVSFVVRVCFLQCTLVLVLSWVVVFLECTFNAQPTLSFVSPMTSVRTTTVRCGFVLLYSQ